MFLLPSINLKLRPKILDLKPGTRIVSNTFTMEDWQADETATVTDGCSSSWCTALFWVVPAKVAGTWNTPSGALTLTQNFQMLSGTLGNQAVQGRLSGNEIIADGRHPEVDRHGRRQHDQVLVAFGDDGDEEIRCRGSGVPKDQVQNNQAILCNSGRNRADPVGHMPLIGRFRPICVRKCLATSYLLAPSMLSGNWVYIFRQI